MNLPAVARAVRFCVASQPRVTWSLCLLILLTCDLDISLQWATGTLLAAEQDTSQPARTGRETFAPEDYFDSLQLARQQLEKRQFKAAGDLYRKLIATFPDDGATWLGWGECQLQLGQHAEAARSFARASELGAATPASMAIKSACAHALMGDKDEAFAWIDRALAHRMDDRFPLRINAQLKGLRDDARFQRALGQLPPGEIGRDAGWRIDLAMLASEVNRVHIDPFHLVTREAFQEALDSLDRRIPHLSDEQVMVEMQMVIAMLGDGHSRVPLVRGKKFLPRLPLSLYQFVDGLYVIDATAEYKQWVGARVVQIQDTPADEALAATSKVVSRDNPMGILAAGPVYLTLPVVLQSLGLVDDVTRVTVVLEDRGGQRENVVLTGQEKRFPFSLHASRLSSAPPAPVYLKQVEDAFWFERLADTPILFVQFNSVGDKKEETIAQFSERLRERCMSDDVRHMVLDLRHNGGGNTLLTVPFLRTLIHFEATHPEGRLFVLIGRETFSACMNFATDIDRLTNAVFVGEPTGSRPNFVGESTNILLPYSGIRASISSLYWQQGYPMDHRLWIAPEIPVALSSADYFANRDPALEAILKVIERIDSAAK